MSPHTEGRVPPVSFLKRLFGRLFGRKRDKQNDASIYPMF